MTITRLVLAAFAAGCLVPATALAAEKTLTADRVEVRLDLARDGSVTVTESTLFRFEGGPFTSISRQLSTRETDGIAGIAAAIDGVPCEVGRQPGQIRIEREDGVRVTWRLGALSDTSRTLTLRYRARGVIRRGTDADLFSWRAIPGRRAYLVRHASIVVTWPEGATLAGAPRVSAGSARVSPGEPGREIVVDETLPPATGLDLVFPFTLRSVTPDMASWQARQERGRAAAPAIVMSSATILLAGLAWIMVFWIGHRREPLPGADSAPRATPPEQDLPVALAAALVEPGASASWSHALATLLDLAARGIVRVEELEGRTWQGSREYLIHLVARPTGLRAHEAALLDLLFAPKSGELTSVKLSAAGRAAQSHLQPFKRAVGDELVTAGLVSPDRAQTKGALVRWALVLVVVAAAGFAAAAMLTPDLNGWPLLVPGAVMAVALTILIMASQYSVLSTAGSMRGAVWRAFFSFIQQVANGRRPISDPAWLDRYLPFAAARGVGHRFVRRFEKAAAAPGPPPWLSISSSRPGGRAPLAALADFLARARAAGATQHSHV